MAHRSFSPQETALSADLLPSFLDELNDTDLLPLPSSESVAPFGDSRAPSETTATPFHGHVLVSNDASISFPIQNSSAASRPSDELLFTSSTSKNGPEAGSETLLVGDKVAISKAPMQNSTRKRQKEEISYLRDKVQSLEKELETKKGELIVLKSQDNGPLTVQIRGRRDRAMRWQHIAKHQLVEKQRAEMQNLQLRKSLMDQIKLTRSLQKLIKKHASRKDEGTETAQLQARLEFSNCCHEASEAELYERLLRDMDAVYAEVDDICARHPVMQSLEEGCNVSSLHVGETSALYLEATNSKVVPFGMEATCSAVWRCLSREHVKLADGTYHGVKSSPDSISAKAITTLRVNNTAARMQMRFAMKKFVEKDRLVITLESASESEGPRDLLHGLKMMQRAWIVIRPVPHEPENDAYVDGNELSEETIIQLCLRLTPSLSATVLDTPGQRAGAITELLLAAVYRNLGWLFQTVENILMEHGLSQTSRPV